MENLLYVMLLEKTKIYKNMNKAAVLRHVENIRKLDDEGKLELCGVLRKCPGFAGMIILKAESYEEANELRQFFAFFFLYHTNTKIAAAPINPTSKSVGLNDGSGFTNVALRLAMPYMIFRNISSPGAVRTDSPALLNTQKRNAYGRLGSTYCLIFVVVIKAHALLYCGS